MEFDQTAIIDKTRKLVSPFNLARTLVMIIIYVLVVIVAFILLEVDLDPVVISVIVVILTAYFISKDYLLSQQTTRMMRTHQRFLEAKHGELLYLPILGRSGSLFHLKQAALFIREETLSIEVFGRRTMRQGPLEGIAVARGDDFSLCSCTHDAKLPILSVKSQIKGQDFSFYVIDDDSLSAYFLPDPQPLEKEVT